jgi:predicted dehydrogenase
VAAGPSIRVGIVTEPDAAHLKWYLTSLARSEGVESVALADASGRSFESAPKLLGPRLGKPATFRDYREMLAKVRPQLALVTLEPRNSPPPIEAALAAGCHVLSEKPACIRLEDFERLARLAAERKRQLMLALCNRNSPTARKARELIQSGAIGKLYGANIYLVADQGRLTKPEYHRLWRAIKAKAGGGILIWLGIHYLDLAEYMTGARVREVCGFYGNVGGQPIDTEDAAVVSLRFDNGMVGTMQSGYYLGTGIQTEFAFWGSHGWLRFEPATPGSPMRWESTRPGTPKGVQTFRDTSGFMDNGDNQYFPYVQSAVNAARGVEPPPMTTDQSLHVLRAIYGAYRASDTGTTQKV